LAGKNRCLTPLTGANNNGQIVLPWRQPVGSTNPGAPEFQQIKVLGGEGNNYIYFAHGSDTGALQLLDPVAANDSLSYGPGPVVPGNPPSGTDPLNVANEGNWFGWLDGGTGNSTLVGPSAPDQIFGGPGSDLLYGGQSYMNRLWADSPNATVLAGSQRDTLFGGGGSATNPTVGSDLVGPPTSGGSNVVHADPGFTFASGDPSGSWGFNAGDYAQGATANNLDIVDSSNSSYAGSNTLFGGPGNDTIIGGPGPDLIVGGGNTTTPVYGNDSLAGGGGTDTITGGTASDPAITNTKTDTGNYPVVTIQTPCQNSSVTTDVNVPWPSPAPQAGAGAVAPTNGTLVAQKVALTAVVNNEQLSHFMDVGDVTGDGVDDYLAWGTQNFYLVPGPLNPEGV
jgi:Ca2+-binding RTX toxin-like protein